MKGYAEFAEGSSPNVMRKYGHTLQDDCDFCDEYVSNVMKDLLQYVQGMRERLALRDDEYAIGEPVNHEPERDKSEAGRTSSQR